MLRDIRYALRTLRVTPGFAITVVLTLGIGLGLNTTLFTLFNAYVLHPFAVQDPYSLYAFGWEKARHRERTGLTWEQYQDLRTEVPVFSESLVFSPFLARVDSRQHAGHGGVGELFHYAACRRAAWPADPAGRCVNARFGCGRGARLSSLELGVRGRSSPSSGGRSESPTGRSRWSASVPRISPDSRNCRSIFSFPSRMQSAVVPGPDLFGPDKPRGALVIGRLQQGVPLDRAKAALTVWIKHATEQLPARRTGDPGDASIGGDAGVD